MMGESLRQRKEQELVCMLSATQEKKDNTQNYLDPEDIIEHTKRRYRRLVVLGFLAGIVIGLAIGQSFPKRLTTMQQQTNESSLLENSSSEPPSPQRNVKLFFDEYPSNTTKIEIRGKDELGEQNYRIPSSIIYLTDLSSLVLDYNYLKGPIPTELGMLRKLTHLDLHGNTFSGSIPANLFMLSKLTYLDLGSNLLLSGTLPTELLSSFPKLQVLDLSRNKFDGGLSSQLGELEQLTMLLLNSNNFSQTVPTEIESLEHLKTLWLQNNPMLSGTIPTSLCRKISPQDLKLSETKIEPCPAQ